MVAAAVCIVPPVRLWSVRSSIPSSAASTANLWILRINAGARLNGLSYSRLMHGLNKAGIALNRKVLADLAVYHKDDFAKVVEMAKAAL